MSAYRKAEPEYFEQRTLKRHARVLHLWALGVAAVISGDFFGWNFGLITGGFEGMVIATAIMTVIAAGFDHNAPAKASPVTTSEPAMTEGPRSDIFTSTANDDFFDVGGDDDLPSFLR